MLILRSLPELRSWRNSLPPGAAVGFVPTMGALHAGHMRLVEECRRNSDVTVVSIFVNPLQFGPAEDLDRYPRPFARDAALCEAAGVDAIFAPEAGGFYAPDHSTFVEVEGLDRHLCGASRPGHFRGVCTVVLKLFHLVRPRRAWFGRKDIQQARILEKMASDLSLDLEVVLSETVREPSGLALSSRNAYLTADERERATALHRALAEARDAWRAGQRDADALKAAMRETIAASGARLDYAEIVSLSRLAPLETIDVPAVAAVAAWYGNTRLIDNEMLA